MTPKPLSASRVFGPLLGLLLLLPLGLSLGRSGRLEASVPQQQAQRIYTLSNLVTFDGSSCLSGWASSNPGDSWEIRCTWDWATDGSGAVWLYGPRYGVRQSAILWRNDLFPSSGNLAIEIRFRYPRMRKPYGQDAYTFYDRTYSGQRVDDQWGNACQLEQNDGNTWVDPVCSDSRVAGYSHGAGNNRNRIVALDYLHRHEWAEVDPAQWWTVVYHYDATDSRWSVQVRPDSAPQWERGGFVQPVTGPYAWETSGLTGRGRPVGFKVGHHVRKISPAQPGEWNEAMVDYVAVWTWNEATPTPLPTSTPTHTPTPTDTPTPTPTPTSTPTPSPSPTPMPTQTPTSTPTPTPTPTDPSLVAEYPYLVWYGPDLPGESLPPQRLYGYAEPGVDLAIDVRAPWDADGGGCGTAQSYYVTADSLGHFSLGAGEVGDPLFGTKCRGDWQAQAEDLNHGTFSDIVSWQVSWFPIHLSD